MKKGFDTNKYLEIQSAEILKRVGNSQKLYLEFGGKIYDDFHAARVLPGYEPNAKIKMLQMIKKDSEIIFCISAKDIESSKMRADSGLTYEALTLKTVNDLKDFGLDISTVVINRFSKEKKALKFKKYLENIGIKVYLHKEISGYPADIDKIVSQDGYGQNCYVETSKSIVVVTGVAPGSGKMSFCLSQLYHDNLKEIKSSFSKFETFPIWNLPLEHPVNLAYEAATADLGDVNMIDPFYLKSTGKKAVNYNRDIENFPILKKILKKIGNDIYNSPTEMGVSRAKDGIFDEEAIIEAAKQEVVRRYFRHKKELVFGMVEKDVVDRIEKIMKKLKIDESYRNVTGFARKAAIEAEGQEGKGNNQFYCGAAIQIGKKVITGKNSELLHAESACIINALKYLSKIPDEILLLPKLVIDSVKRLREKTSKNSNPSLDVSEVLIALSICSSTNPTVEKCLDKISLLKNCEMHMTHLLTRGDESGIRDLGINATTDAELTPRIHF